MKQSTVIAFLLTILSGALILLAASVFLFQGRQTLLERVDRLSESEKDLTTRQEQLQQELTNRNLALTAVEATRAALAVELDDASDQLTVAQQEAASLTVELHQANSQLSQAETFLYAPPEAEFIAPEDGRFFNADEPIEIIIAANQATAALTLTLTINDEEIGQYVSDGRSLLIVRENWQPPGDGRYVIAAHTFGVNGAAGQTVSVAIEVVDVLAQNERIRAEIEANVVELRGLEPLRPITLTQLTADQLRDRLTADLAEEMTPEKARDDALVYVAFDFLDADFDLYGFLIDLYSEQVAGFYDPETAEFVVISDGEGLSLFGEWIYAHEYVHALQDQHFDLSRLSDDELNSEQRFAIRALAEGEATLVQVQYLTDYFSQADIMLIFEEIFQTEQTMLEQAPPILRDSLNFPYEAGFEFVTYLYDQGGWAAVDDAWANPPQSTAHILHPERYVAGDAAIAVSLPPLTGTLGVDWRLLEEDVLGEFYLRQYLSQQLSPSVAATAAAGWGGDWYAVYANEADELVMVLRLAWEAPAEAAEFAAAYANFAARRSQANAQTLQDGRCWAAPTDLICLYESGGETLIIRAPDAIIMTALADAINR